MSLLEQDYDKDSASPEPDTKRRRIRKGTTSCWDCKKRKVKCTFDATSSTVCIACRRRGAPCVGQDQPEGETQIHGNRDPLAGRVQRIEELLEQLIELGHNVEKNVALAGLRKPSFPQSGYFTPLSEYRSRETCSSPSEPSATPNIATTVMTDECRQLSDGLIKAFPCQEDINTFCKYDYIATFYCHQILTRSGERPEQEAIHLVNEIAKIPDRSMPPVLIAKRMLILALFLHFFQSMHPHSLKEHPTTIKDRLVDTAVRFISMDERGFGFIEGVECIILEGVYHTNLGNLRRAWLAFRKAIVIAQMMKMDHPNPPPIRSLDPNTKMDPRFMWFRIVYMDSYLSLMLGLPHGGQETNMEGEIPGETPSCRLERIHTMMARRIIDRNKCDASLQNLQNTREIDRKLLEAARSMPDGFWSPQDYTDIQPNTKEAFWETMRLCDQIFHYNIVHLLHLPFLLRDDRVSSYYTYSKISCVNACREIVQRYIAYRNFNRNIVSVFCRTADFFALMAGMTILLAHIDGHRQETEDWRAHQRASDRALVVQLLASLDKLGKRTNDSLTLQSATQLHHLLEIEGDAARGVCQSAQDTVHCLEEHCGELKLSIPYFGIIKIAREGITKDTTAVDPTSLESWPARMPDSVHVANHVLSAAGIGHVLQPFQEPSTIVPVPDLRAMHGAALAIPNGSAMVGSEQQQPHFPGLAATVDDWAFQGVDAAFFDSLMRGSSSWEPGMAGNV